MEIIPILDESCVPAPGHWYVISNDNQSSPSCRVGHTLSVHPITNNIYLCGGANPDGVFSDTYYFHWPTLKWTSESSFDPLIGRYEHTASWLYLFHTNTHKALLPQEPPYLCAFGGAEQSQNLNNCLLWNAPTKEWNQLQQHKHSARPPMPRTHHTTCTLSSQWMLFFSGGSTGAEPVADQLVYLLGLSNMDPSDSGANSIQCYWLHVRVSGNAPKSRSGHLLVAVDADNALLYGGMNGNKFYDDVHHLSIQWERDAEGHITGASGVWKLLTPKSRRDIPCGRAAHAGVYVSSNTNVHEPGMQGKLIVFGGLTASGKATNDLYTFDLKSKLWNRIVPPGSTPANRLDCAYTLGRYAFPLAGEESNSDGDQAKTSRMFLFIHGGMDTEGNVFDDTLVFVLPEELDSPL